SQQNFRLRSKQQLIIEDAPVERLFTETVARYEELAAARIPEREREHSVKMLDHPCAVLFIKMRQNFRVRLAAKRVPARFQFFPKLAVVVNLAVENDAHLTVFIQGRLLARHQINDCQTAHPQR